MRYNVLYRFLLFAACFFVGNGFAQERVISGNVTTLEQLAVIGANVKVLSSKSSVFTDSLGKFSIHCLPKDKIKITAKGFYNHKVTIHKGTNNVAVNLVLKPSTKNVDMAIGYGHINEKDKTYAIKRIANDNYKFAKYSNMLDLIANSSPSIIINGGQILIRGESSLKGSSAALILINGIEASSSQLLEILPINVKSVDILKGSSAAIYGSRGANGVVIITTKRGDDLD